MVHSPARAFAWQFLRRHRWGFIAIGIYLALLALRNPLSYTPARAAFPDSEQFAFTVIVPTTAALMYLLAVFTFGFRGDLEVRESLYPARFYTLPVTTHSLVLWPMLYGMAAVSLLLVWTIRFGFRAAGLHAPMIWPPLFAAVFLGWAQALTWMPYPWRGTRAVLATGWLVLVDTIVLVAVFKKLPEWEMLAFLALQLPVVYAVAYRAVALGRRGHVPELGFSMRRTITATSRPQRPFGSAARAQAWFEWQQQGRVLVKLVAMVVPFELAMLFIGKPSFGAVQVVVIMVLLTPPFMAVFTATNAQTGSNGDYGLSTFTATRPLSTSSLVAAKLQAALWSTLLTWLMVLAGIVAALILSHTWGPTVERVRAFALYVGTARAVVAFALVLLVLVLTTWRQLVQSLYIGLTGRAWLIKGVVFAMLVLLVAIVPVGWWLFHRSDVMAALWRNLRWILATLVLLKMSAAAWTSTRLFRSRLVSDRALMTGAALWLIGVLVLHGLLLWWLSTPHFPAYFLALIAILIVPLARLSAAPLALAWNRHR